MDFVELVALERRHFSSLLTHEADLSTASAIPLRRAVCLLGKTSASCGFVLMNSSPLSIAPFARISSALFVVVFGSDAGALVFHLFYRHFSSVV